MMPKFWPEHLVGKKEKKNDLFLRTEQVWGQSFKQVTFEHLVDIWVEMHIRQAVE